MQSVLGRARTLDIVDEPFPHIVIQNALEADYYEQLADEFPAAEIILNGREPEGNRNLRYAANDILDDARISARWREFTRYHVSQAFFDEVCSLFGSHIRKLHPHLEGAVFRKLSDWRSSVRFREPCRDIALECQFAYAAPGEQPSRIIGPHVDREVALFAGLFYMRDDKDDSSGGDLELYRFTDGQPAFEKDSRRVPEECVTRSCSIRYAKNTLVLFLHSPKSVHGVSPRSVTTFPRHHINFVGELAAKVFDVSPFATLAVANPSEVRGPVI